MNSRVYYPWQKLEEHKAGMWRQIAGVERFAYIKASGDLLRDPAAFLVAMLRVVEEWPRSLEMALTTPSLNQRAYMGCVGCCIATGSPEELTRLGWHTLTSAEQDAANDAADQAISAWRHSYRPANTLF